MKSLRKLLPYFTPYWVPLTAGLFLVVASAAFTSVIHWLPREALLTLGGRDWTLLRR